MLDIRLKALPLRLRTSCIEVLVRRVCPVDQAEVDSGLGIRQPFKNNITMRYQALT